MSVELLIRPSMNDHKVVADLLAPGGPGAGRPISRLVVSAQDAARQPQFGELAAKSGTPFVIDPMSVLLQSEVAPDDPWVVELPYSRAEKLTGEQLRNQFILDSIVAECVAFQVSAGASVIIPPYFYAVSPESAEFEASLAAISRTARRMRQDGVSLPIVPVLCAQLQGFAHRPGWQAALDRFVRSAADVGPQALGLYLSPVGAGDERYAKVLDLLAAARYVASYGVPTIAWRQGAYGPALVAAGVSGYECGMGIGEQSNVSGYLSQHRPRPSKDNGGFAAGGIFLPALGRSVPMKVAQALLHDRRISGRLLCESPRCCPRGAESMLASRGRSHAVRARARALTQLAEIPDAGWRLHHVGKQAASAHVLATKANEILAAAGISNTIKTDGFASLEQAAEFLRMQGPASARDRA